MYKSVCILVDWNSYATPQIKNIMKSIVKIALGLLFILSNQFASAQVDTTRMFIFGHSLLDHRPPAIPTPSDETTVPHWFHLLTEHDNNYFEIAGQYGFLPQHANLPPFAQWGYDIVPGAWESDTEDFSEADFNQILITAGNFMQWQGPDEPYPGEGGMTPISATEEIVDWLEVQEDSLGIYIYENWPDMAPYISGESFPPSEMEFENYNDYTTGEFHDWWLEYQDSLLLSRPDINVRMIPVGPIMAQLFRDTILTEIPILDLYEDNAPHGRPTVYFVASLITYMAVHNEIAAMDYDVPPIVNSIVEDNYEALVNYIWNELNDFNDDSGLSRVFYPEAPLPLSLLSFDGYEIDNEIELTWVTAYEEYEVQFEIEHSEDGYSFEEVGIVEGQGYSTDPQTYNFRHSNIIYPSNFYRLRQISPNGEEDLSEIIIVELESGTNEDAKKEMKVFPNPVESNLMISDVFFENLNYEIFNILGSRVSNGSLEMGNQEIDLVFLEKGVYVLKIENKTFKLLKL